MSIKFFTNSINKIYYGTLVVSKIYKGSSVCYEQEQQTSFDYIYNILNLTYISNIEHSIIGFNYEY